MRALLIMFVLGACGGMQHRDAMLEAAYFGATFLDMKQTEVIVQRGNGWEEANPIIGPNAEHMEPAAYFPLTMALHLAITAAIPNGHWRTAWQSFTLGIAIKTVHTNYLDGVRIQW